jgi:hypothetical protein
MPVPFLAAVPADHRCVHIFALTATTATVCRNASIGSYFLMGEVNG